MPRFAWVPDDLVDSIDDPGDVLLEPPDEEEGHAVSVWTPPPRARGPPATTPEPPRAWQELRRHGEIEQPPLSPAWSSPSLLLPALQLSARTEAPEPPLPPRLLGSSARRGPAGPQGPKGVGAERGGREAEAPWLADGTAAQEIERPAPQVHAEQTDTAGQLWQLRAELARAADREAQLLEELEAARRKAARERARRRAAELALERCRMEAEDARRPGSSASAGRLPRLSPSPSSPSSSPSATSLLSDAAAAGGRTLSEQLGRAVRRNSFGLPLSPGTPPRRARRSSPPRTPPSAALCQAENLVLEMFSAEPSSVRSSQAQSLRGDSRSPRPKEPEPSPSPSAHSDASAQTEPLHSRSYDLCALLSASKAQQGALALVQSGIEQSGLEALNGRMPSFPAAVLGAPKAAGTARRRGSWPLPSPTAGTEGHTAVVPGPACAGAHGADTAGAGGAAAVGSVATAAAASAGDGDAGRCLAGLANAVATAMGSPEPWSELPGVWLGASNDVTTAAAAVAAGARSARCAGAVARPAAGGRAEVSPPAPTDTTDGPGTATAARASRMAWNQLPGRGGSRRARGATLVRWSP